MRENTNGFVSNLRLVYKSSVYSESDINTNNDKTIIEFLWELSFRGLREIIKE